MKRIAADLWDGIRFQPARSALSVLAVCVGMTSLTILLAVMGGLRQKSRELMEDMGANVFVVMPGERTDIIHGDLTLDKRSMLASSLTGTIVSALRTFSIRVSNFSQPIRVFAVDENYFQIHSPTVTSGRNLDALDHATGARVAVVSDTLAHDANWQLGQAVYLGSSLYTIVGIVERPGSALEKETSDKSFVPDNTTLFVPLASSRSWMSNASITARKVDLIEVKCPEPSQLESTVSAARRLLAGRNEADAFTWITPASVLADVKRLERIIALTAGSVSLLCLVLGGTTLMSLMVANVRDRVLEIALRRTIGATARDIASLFLAEACLVTLCGSLAGLALAAFLISLSSGHFLLPVHMGASVVVLPLIVAVIMGMCFSYLPVRMATAITPAEALRND